MNTPVRLTQFAKGAGCGCKISPTVLQSILSHTRTPNMQGALLVGNAGNDDAAAYDLKNGTALIATADFFMPVVDDAFTFGKIAAANAISDVYAMGGKPILALAILGWPIEKLTAELAARVLDGAREICNEAGITIAGGHTIESPEPFFGLSVNGLVPVPHLKQNNAAQTGDLIVLTKPLGTGILTTAMKRDKLQDIHMEPLIQNMTALNAFGAILGPEPAVTALTDITGFGLAGHLLEVCEGSGLSAEINFSNLPLLDGVLDYIQQGIIPDATYRNWNAYGNRLEMHESLDPMHCFGILPDPQTNGGLMVVLKPDSFPYLQELAKNNNTDFIPIGRFIDPGDKTIYFC